MAELTSILTEAELEMEGTGEDEEIPISIEPGRRSLKTSSVDAEIESLYGKWKRGKLILQADFQRQFVWDRAKASRLIESALLAVPLPIIYLAQEDNSRESVIDGQQRLTSFFSFIDGVFPNKQPFRLSGLKVFPELTGKAFADLEESLQDKIRYYSIRTITILTDSDADLKFEIFERLNTGAVPLNDMELRNCVYRGPYMALLKELAADPDFKQLVGLKEPDTRMRDIELVLRFAAFYHATYLKYQSPMKRFFNRDMEKYRNISAQEADHLRHAYKNGLQIIKSLFGDRAFHRYQKGTSASPNGAWEEKRFNASLYDALMGAFCERDKNQVYGALDSLREGLIDLMATDQEFIDAILLGTSQPIRVRKRFDMVRLLVDSVLASRPEQPRCFSLKLKQELHERDARCALCKQHIQHIDDAAVDHIEQYWRGGKTIPENARLAHRYCNTARPRND